MISADLKHHRPPQPVPPLQPHHLPGERWRFATKHKDAQGCTRIVMTNCHLNDVLTLHISQLRNTFPSSNTPFSPLQLPRHRARHGSRSRTLGHGCSTGKWVELMVWMSFNQTGLKVFCFFCDPCNNKVDHLQGFTYCVFGWMLVKILGYENHKIYVDAKALRTPKFIIQVYHSCIVESRLLNTSLDRHVIYMCGGRILSPGVGS